MRLASLICFLLLAANAVPALGQDVLVGAHGERLIGRVVSETPESITFDSNLGGRLTIARSQIQEIHRSAAPTSPTNSPSAPGPVTVAPWKEDPSFDWIQLSSGEWLKGRIKGMQERELDFYSEKLKDLNFDWKDIRKVHSAHRLDVLLIDGRRFQGTVDLTTNGVTIAGQPGMFPVGQIQSFTPSGQRERQHWSGTASAGLTLRAGNTEQVEYNAQVHLQRRTPGTRLSLDYLGNISSVDGVESANNHRVNSEFDRWLSHRLYLILPALEYYRDPFQNLAHRLTAGVGIGYDLIDRSKLNWNISTGPAFQQAWFESVQPGTPEAKSATALTFGSRFDWDITHSVELILEYRGQYTSPEVGETTHHSVSTLSVDLTSRINLDVTFVWDRIANPKVAADGTEPKPDDFRLIVGLGLDL